MKNTPVTKKPLKMPPANKTRAKSVKADPQPNSMDIASLHADLHALTVMPADQEAIREAFRKRVMEYTKAVGVAHLIMDENSKWSIKSTHASGRVPQREDFVAKFAQNCEATLKRRSIQMETFLGLQAIFAPVNIAGTRPEVMMILCNESNMGQTVFLVEIIMEYFGLWLKDSKSNDNAWKLTSLAALIELVTSIECCDHPKEACETVANELLRHLQCQHVAVGQIKDGKIQVQAISGQTDTITGSNAFQQNLTALNECLLREEFGCWPPSEEGNEHLLLAHKQLAKEFDFEAVASLPIRTADGEITGALLVGGSKPMITGNRLPNFLRASAPRIGNALDVVRRAQPTLMKRLTNTAQEQLKTVKGRIWYGIGVVLLAAMLLPIPYRVRCTCKLDATTRRFAVAPFDGIVKHGAVEPGATISKGDLLASMDGQSLRFRMASVAADLAKANKEREIQLSHRDIPSSMVAGLEAKSLHAEKQLLDFQSQQIEICSPIDGVVLSGSLEKAEGASVTKGDVLYEVGPIDQLNIEIAIPAEEIAHVNVDQNVRVWIDGFESKSFTAKINKVSPRSELRDARNVFVAEVTINNPEFRYRPGMKGHVRIDCRRHSLAWNMLHKPWNYIVSRLTWW